MENNLQQIRNGLINYICSCINASSLEGNNAKQLVSSILIEEAINLSISENGEYNLFCLKPLFRGINVILQKRIEELEKINTNSSINTTIQEYKEIINIFNKLLDNIKGDNL